MGRKPSILLMLVIASMVSCGTANAANNKSEPAKQGIIDRIKSAYTNFRAKMEKKEAVKTAPVTKAAPKPAAPKPQPAKKMTKEELVAALKDEIASEEEIFTLVPELKAEKDNKGNISYSYKGTSIEGLSEEELSGLLTRVRQNLVKYRTERIQQQMETVKQTQNLKPVIPARPPSSYAAPRLPSTPPTSQSIPKRPAPPPAPPTRK